MIAPMDVQAPNQSSNALKTQGLGRSKFETELLVRPDDIDMNQHVHSSKYFDYVLAARYEQMARCYKMAMEEFLKRGLGWFVRVAHVEHKRPLMLGEAIIVRTWVEDVMKESVRVNFEILKRSTGKLSADGYCIYTMVNLSTGRAEPIAADILEKYSI